MATEHHEIIIVGGGTAGVFAARKLVAAGIKDVVVLESRPVAGGRVTTTRDEESEPLFNNFAWRISEENIMMIALAKELGIKLIPQTTPAPTKETKQHGDCKHGVLSSTCEIILSEKQECLPNRPPLSDFGRASLQSASEADKQDRESGYAGRTAQISWPDESHGKNTFFVEGGMDRIPREIANQLPEGCFRSNHRVADVERIENGGYKVSVVARGKDGFTPITMTCSQVILATPPYTLRFLTVAQDMLPAVFAVHERRLGHVYAQCKPGTSNVPDTSTGKDRIYRMLPDSILQQIISGDYGGGVFQAAYACDRFERVWRELQFQGPEVAKHQVKEQLSRISALKDFDVESIEEIFIRISFVHRWHIESHLTGKTKEELSLQALTPNLAKLPGLFLIGEAFSPYQGWTEGALWTANQAVKLLIDTRQSPCVYAPKSASPFSAKLDLRTDDNGKLMSAKSPSIMTFRSLVVDISDWASRHPGGPNMIKGHAGEDLSDLFQNFHGYWPAPLATLFGLQVGCVDES